MEHSDFRQEEGTSCEPAPIALLRGHLSQPRIPWHHHVPLNKMSLITTSATHHELQAVSYYIQDDDLILDDVEVSNHFKEICMLRSNNTKN